MGFFLTPQEKLDKAFVKACIAGNLERAQGLLDTGANVDSNRSGAAVLYWAVKDSQEKTVEFLLRNKADIKQICVNILAEACERQNEKIVKMLLDYGVDVNEEDATGRTALYAAAYYNNAVPIIQMLLDAGANIDKQEKQDGHTALHRAIYWNRFPIVQVLVENGADTNIRNHRGETPECMAARENYRGIENFLKEKRTQPPTVQENVVQAGWKVITPVEIAHVSDKKAVGYALTDIFNFESRMHTRIARNLQTNAESQTVKFFDEFTDKKLLEEAYQALTNRGGKADSRAVYGSVLVK